MKRTFLILSLTLASLPLPAQWTPEEMMKVKSIGTVQVSPDGRRVAFSVTEAVMTEDRSEFVTQIWLAAADGSGGFALTRGQKSSQDPRWSPDGLQLAFVSNRSGKDNLWLIRADGGEPEMLTDVPTGVSGFAWAPDGAAIAFAMTDPPGEQEEKDRKAGRDARVVGEDLKMKHLWLVPLAPDAHGQRTARRLTQGGFNVGTWDWSPDGRTIVFDHAPTPVADDWRQSDISVVDLASGAVKPLASTRASESSPLYSPDGSRIAFSQSDDPPTWGQTLRAVLVPVSGGPAVKLAPTFDEQPVLKGWSADGSGLYFVESQGTTSRLGFLPADGAAPRLIDPGDGGVFDVFLSRGRTAFGLSRQSPDSAPEAFVTSASSWSPVAVSRANAASPGHPLGRTEVIRWRGADKLEIEGLLTYPVGDEPGRRYPLVLVIHGGPAGVFSQNYLAGRGVYPLAAFAAEGWAVLRCNTRGSSGYGRAFRYANHADWGGGDYRDLLAGVDRVIAMGVADPSRLGVMGWSYGGYMTSWVITQTKRFKAASIGAPVTNLVSFTGTTDIPSFIPSYSGAEFWNDLEAYLKHSAIFNIKGVSTPALIQHGEQDLRVPFSQGQELYSALKRQGVKVKMVAYPREPHGLREPRHILDAANRNLDWFREHLGPGR